MKPLFLRATHRYALRGFLFAASLVAACAGFVYSQSLLPVYKNGSGNFVIDYELGGDIDKDDFFYLPADIALDSRGNLFVLDFKECCVKKFDPDGVFVNTFGRKGEGPGELALPSQMELDMQDQVVVYDRGNQRFTVFDNMGEVLGTTNVNTLGSGSVYRFRIDSKGRHYIEIHEQRFQDVDEKTKAVISRIDLGAVRVTPIDSILFRHLYFLSSGEVTTSIRAPFYDGRFWGVRPGGDIVIANPADYSIRFYSPDLAVVREMRHESERRKVTEKDKSDYFEGWDEEELLRLRHKVEFPKYRPYFENLIIDGDGYLLFRVDEPTETTQLYDVFTPGGDFLNRVTLPRLHPQAILSGGYIYTITQREEDPIVRRYRLE